MLASLEAKDNIFIGINAGMSYSKFTRSYLGGEQTIRSSSTYQNAHIGKHFDAHRVSLTIQSGALEPEDDEEGSVCQANTLTPSFPT